MAMEITTAKDLALVLVQGLAFLSLAGAVSMQSVQNAAMDAARLGASTDELYRALTALNRSGQHR